MNNVEYGKSGEQAAINYIEKLGYEVIETNYASYIGEIDIIALDKGCYVFIEVKTRSSQNYGLPKEAVNMHKQRKYGMLVMQYIKNNNLFNSKCRIDVIEVTGEDFKINHLKNAFGYIR